MEVNKNEIAINLAGLNAPQDFDYSHRIVYIGGIEFRWDSETLDATLDDRSMSITQTEVGITVRHNIFVYNNDFYVVDPADFEKEVTATAWNDTSNMMRDVVTSLKTTHKRIAAQCDNIRFGYTKKSMENMAMDDVITCAAILKSYSEQKTREYHKYEFQLVETFATDTSQPVFVIESAGIQIMIINPIKKVAQRLTSNLIPIGITSFSLGEGIKTHGPEPLEGCAGLVDEIMKSPTLSLGQLT